MDTSYSPPVRRLLELGRAELWQPEWPDYPAELGLTREHVPELLDIVQDTERVHELGEDDPRVYAPVHAWRALGQLRAEEAVDPLLAHLMEYPDDDWVTEEVPTVLGMIGRPALAAVGKLLASSSEDLWATIAAARSLVEIARRDPSTRDEVVRALVRKLGWYARNDPDLNGFLISYLVELRAVEAAPLMERAFADDAVEIAIPGDWEDVQVGLGLLEERITPRPRYYLAPLSPEPAPARQAARGKDRKQKSRRKAARASRRRNRR